MLEHKKDLTLYAAIFKPTGEFWNFQLSEWVPNQCLKCFTVDPNVVESSWGRDNGKVLVCEYKTVQTKQYRSERNAKH